MRVHSDILMYRHMNMRTWSWRPRWRRKTTSRAAAITSLWAQIFVSAMARGSHVLCDDVCIPSTHWNQTMIVIIIVGNAYSSVFKAKDGHNADYFFVFSYGAKRFSVVGIVLLHFLYKNSLQLLWALEKDPYQMPQTRPQTTGLWEA